jgi:DNA modification methylase
VAGRITAIGTAVIYEGDCLSIMQNFPKVDMVLADLPYGTTNCRWDTPIDLTRLWECYEKVCNGPILLFAQTPFDKILGASNLRDLRYEWIWEKTEATGHLNAKKAPMKAHENILVFYRRPPTYNPIKTTGHARKTAVRHRAVSEVYGAQTPGSAYDSTERYPRSVITFSTDKQQLRLHPTQKPVALLDYLIRTYTNPGDTVLDNTMGSGSTGVAALSADRKFIGIELHSEIFDTACKRLSEHVNGGLTA